MSEGITERGLQLLEMASIKALADAGETDYVRWQNIKRGRSRLGADEIEILGRVYPHYRWWLMTGEVRLDMHQTSPAYDLANASLHEPSAG
ncbi:DNA-binding protein [Pseudomonas sp. ATCC 13867]|nr:DNA-binding protein [Pseudomonas sp. ATCC 13867]